MEADELRGVTDPRLAGGAARRTRFAWLRRYVHSRVDDRLAPGALERALAELRTRPEDAESDVPGYQSIADADSPNPTY